VLEDQKNVAKRKDTEKAVISTQDKTDTKLTQVTKEIAKGKLPEGEGRGGGESDGQGHRNENKTKKNDEKNSKS